MYVPTVPKVNGRLYCLHYHQHSEREREGDFKSIAWVHSSSFPQKIHPTSVPDPPANTWRTFEGSFRSQLHSCNTRKQASVKQFKVYIGHLTKTKSIPTVFALSGSVPRVICSSYKELFCYVNYDNFNNVNNQTIDVHHFQLLINEIFSINLVDFMVNSSERYLPLYKHTQKRRLYIHTLFIT